MWPGIKHNGLLYYLLCDMFGILHTVSISCHYKLKDKASNYLSSRDIDNATNVIQLLPNYL